MGTEKLEGEHEVGGEYVQTVWPSGLRRLTWNQLSSGCVGSNPATVVFAKFYIGKYRELRGTSGFNGNITKDNVAEWLRRLPAKQFPSGSVGSNPAVVVFWYKKERILGEHVVGSTFFRKRMEMRGIDPRAPRMQSECSTIWATPPYKSKEKKRKRRKKNRRELGLS